MNRLKVLLTVLLVLGVLVPAVGLMAQDDVTTDVPVIGDQDSAALDVVQAYLAERDRAYMATDVTMYDRSFDDPVAVDDMQTGESTDMVFFDGAFTDVSIAPTRYIVTGNTVVVEYTFSGANTEPYDDLSPSGTVISFPVVDIYEVQDNVITMVRRYYDSAELRRQMGYMDDGSGMVAPEDRTTTSPDDQAANGEAVLAVDDITDDPSVYIGQQVMVEGSIGDMVGAHSFYLWDQDLIDLDQEYVIVVSASEDGLAEFYPVEETTARVVGTVREYLIADINAELDYNLDENAFADIDAVAVIVADSAQNEDTVQTIPQVESDPNAFYGRTVTLEGRVGELVDENTFVFYEDQLIGVAGRILATGTDVPNYQGLDEDERVRITGVVQPHDPAFVQSEYAMDVDAAAWADYDELPVLVTTSVTQID